MPCDSIQRARVTAILPVDGEAKRWWQTAKTYGSFGQDTDLVEITVRGTKQQSTAVQNCDETVLEKAPLVM